MLLLVKLVGFDIRTTLTANYETLNYTTNHQKLTVPQIVGQSVGAPSPTLNSQMGHNDATTDDGIK